MNFVYGFLVLGLSLSLVWGVFLFLQKALGL
jgi:hypothetical protein